MVANSTYWDASLNNKLEKDYMQNKLHLLSQRNGQGEVKDWGYSEESGAKWDTVDQTHLEGSHDQPQTEDNTWSEP